MFKYEFYRELGDHMGYVLRKCSGWSKKKVRKMGANPKETAIKMFFQDPASGLTLDAAILADEEDYIHNKRRVYMPQTKGLVEMLWRSKMDVRLPDIEDFPRCFTVAWPSKTIIDGVELPGCLVWFGKHTDRKKLAKMMEKWTDVPIQMIEAGPHAEHEFHLVFGHGSGIDRWYKRASMPEQWVADCLKSADDLKNKLGNYCSLFTQKLTPEEVHLQYVLLKSVLNLMVYATACPDAILPGWPEGVTSSPHTRGREPCTLASPIPKELPHQGGTHSSPKPHLRNAHFRRYPLRNGKRKKGIVLVNECLVNATLDPKTVVKVGRKR